MTTDHWGYGAQSAVRVDGQLAHHETHEVPSREDALDGLEKIAGNIVLGGDDDQWEAFFDRLAAQYGRELDQLDPEDTLDVDIVGPDGIRYWIEEIDHS